MNPEASNKAPETGNKVPEVDLTQHEADYQEATMGPEATVAPEAEIAKQYDEPTVPKEQSGDNRIGDIEAARANYQQTVAAQEATRTDWAEGPARVDATNLDSPLPVSAETGRGIKEDEWTRRVQEARGPIERFATRAMQAADRATGYRLNL